MPKNGERIELVQKERASRFDDFWSTTLGNNKSYKKSRNYCSYILIIRLIMWFLLLFSIVGLILTYLLYSFVVDIDYKSFGYITHSNRKITLPFNLPGTNKDLYDYFTIMFNGLTLVISLHYLYYHTNLFNKKRNNNHNNIENDLQIYTDHSNKFNNGNVTPFSEWDESLKSHSISNNSNNKNSIDITCFDDENRNNSYYKPNIFNYQYSGDNGHIASPSALITTMSSTGQSKFEYTVEKSKKCGIKILNVCIKEFRIEWNSFNIAVFIGTIHQFMTFILLFMSIIRTHDKSWIATAIAYLLKSINYMSLTISLNKFYHHEYQKVKRKKLSFFGHTLTQILFLLGITSQFFMFTTFPTLSRNQFEKQVDFAYDCQYSIIIDKEYINEYYDDIYDEYFYEPIITYNFSKLSSSIVPMNIAGKSSKKNDGDSPCQLKTNFVINEMIFRLFVAITLINLIFFILSIIFGKHFHEPSFNNFDKILHPLLFLFFIVCIFIEITIIGDYKSSFHFYWNIIWMSLNGFTGIYLLFNTIKSQFYEINTYRKKIMSTALAEGIILIIGRLAVVTLALLDKIDKWSAWRQFTIAISLIIQLIALLFYKKPKNKNNDIFICKGQLPLYLLFNWIVFINAYNLIWSIIFETDHFLHFISDDSIITSYLLWEFSFAFCVLHSDLWALSQFVEYAFTNGNNHHNNHH